MRFKLLFFILLLSGISASGQKIKSFPDDFSLYASTLFDFYGEHISKEQEIFLKKFRQDWDSAYFQDNEKKEIINISNSLLDRYARPNPDFTLFLNVMNRIGGRGKYKRHEQVWIESFKEMLNDKQITLLRLNGFMQNTINLLDNNILYKYPPLTWKVRRNDFILENQNGLKVIVGETDLVCNLSRDSITIYNTSGIVDFKKLTWKGTGGNIYWTRSKYSPDEIKAVLQNYQLDLTKPGYTADSVTFSYPRYVPFTIQGKIEDQIEHVGDPARVSYPRFRSYSNLFSIKDIYPNANYKGGFSMEGSKLIGSGIKGQEARMEFKQHDTIMFKAISKNFLFYPDRIAGQNAGVTIYLNKDSMYHANLLFSFSTKENKLTIGKSDAYKTLFPYNNSYHRLDMDFDQLSWSLSEPIIHFSMPKGSTIGKARFESLNYFNYNFFEDLMVLGNTHPLYNLKKYSLLKKSNEFSAVDYADYSRYSISEIRYLMLKLAFSGFIYFDTETDMITLRQKLFDYLSASVGRIDYDVMNFTSTVETPQENATLDLRNLDLNINGVSNIALSDSQNIQIYPYRRHIIMKKNRSFQFSGIVDAGLLSFYGHNFFFDYDSFKLNLQNIDSLRFRIKLRKTDSNGMPIIQNISNMMEHLTGEVLIDNPKNKSGLHRYPRYPIFRSKKNSYVYYDSPTIAHGVYKRDKFYFEAEPFEIDSLDKFSTNVTKFKGKFFSDIVPTLDEQLSIQPDYSLGFVHNANEGLPLYGGKGIFKSQLILSSQGLTGKGELKYLSSTAKSTDFHFYPDSTTALVQDFTLTTTTTGNCPQVDAQNIKLIWLPKKDSVEFTQTDSPFLMFGKQASLTGKLSLTPNGATGSGFMDIREARIRSTNFAFTRQTMKADSSGLSIKSFDSDTLGMVTTNVSSQVDFSSHIGSFTMRNDTTSIQFPENRYSTHLKRFNWDMNKEQIILPSSQKQTGISNLWWDDTEKIDSVLTGAVYLSTDKHRDSLRFVASNTSYNYKKGTLNASGVKYFQIADAVIFPDNESVEINSKGGMQKLFNTRIITDPKMQFQHLYAANIEVYSRNQFMGSAKADYVDMDNKKTPIDFSDVKITPDGHTSGDGKIEEEQNFKLNPGIAFKGSVSLTSQRKYWEFNGQMHIYQTCKPEFSQWFPFKNIIDPNRVLIPVSLPSGTDVTSNGYCGILMRTDSIDTYSAFFTKRRVYSDIPVIMGDGYLFYNRDSALYQIAPETKLKNNDAAGNYIELSLKDCVMKGIGNIDLGARMGHLTLKSGGIAIHKIQEKTFDYTIATAIDFPMLDKSMQIMARDIDSLSTYGPLDPNAGLARKGILEMLGPIDATSYLAALKTAKANKKELPANMQHSIILTNLHLKWNQKTRSYRSSGDVGVVSIMGRPINKYVKICMEITRRRSSDYMDIYLKLSDNDWYYLGYTTGSLHVLSSDNSFMEPIRALSTDKRSVRAEHEKLSYTYLVSTAEKKNRFLQRWEKDNKNEQSQVAEDPDDNEKENSKEKK